MTENREQITENGERRSETRDLEIRITARGAIMQHAASCTRLSSLQSLLFSYLPGASGSKRRHTSACGATSRSISRLRIAVNG